MAFEMQLSSKAEGGENILMYPCPSDKKFLS
jgi:hypothetical protein